MIFKNAMSFIDTPIPKVSVIIPVYNTELFLRQCLDSVITQPMRDIEIICVNDGSTDSSAAILDEYSEKDQRIRVIHQENQGNGIARNSGLDVAVGEYIHFLDSDDYLADSVFEDSYKIACSNKLDYLYLKARTVDAFTCEIVDVLVTDIFSLDIMREQDFEKPFNIEDNYKIMTAIMHWCGLYRREFLLEHNIRFTTLRSHTDSPFYYAVISHAKRVMAADIYAFYYRMNNPNSLMGANNENPENPIKAYPIIKEYCHFLPRHILEPILKYQLKHIMQIFVKYCSGCNSNNSMIKLFQDFTQTIDFLQSPDKCIGEPWYSDYLIFRLEIEEREHILSLSERSKLLADLEKSLWKSIPLPLDEIQRDSKIILYGAGLYGNKTYKLFELSRFCEVVSWVDKDWENLSQESLPVSSPCDIMDKQFDFVLVAAERQKVACEIKRYLIQMGVADEKVISNAVML